MAKKSYPQDLTETVIAHFRQLQARGVRSVYALEGAGGGSASPESTAAAGAAPPDESAPVAAPAAGANAAVGDDAAALDGVRVEVSACTQCALHESRTQTVFGVGDPRARVMFIGEAPGRDEDRKGEPFVGRAGQLLNKILAAIDLRREDVYITNILKCRPPNNRDPQESEVRCCEGYLKRQIALIRPSYICALGRVAAQWLLQTSAPLAALRAGEYTYEGIPVIATYHPAALLRNPGFKKPCWEDMKKLKRLLDETPRRA